VKGDDDGCGCEGEKIEDFVRLAVVGCCML